MTSADRRVFQERLLLLVAVFAIVWAVIRACVQSITMDEADTYAWFVATSNVWYPFSNNHILNTLLMWVSTGAFGPSIIAIRAPSLLGAALYIGICHFLSRSITERFSIQLPLFICLTYNPFIFDYMVAARGYGLANAFLLAAIAVPVWHRVKSRPSLRQPCALASLALGLSFSANYSFAFADLAVFLAITAWAIRRRAGQSVLRIVGFCVLPGLFVALLMCGYPMMHWWGYDYGIGAHSLREMRQSLVQSSLYRLDPRFRDTGWYKAMSFLRPLLPPVLVVLCFCRIVAAWLDGSWREDGRARWLAAAKNYLALRLSVARKVGLILAANPSTMVNLARAGDLEKESLLRDIADGTLSNRFDIPGEVRAGVASRIRKRYPERVREFEEIIRRTGTFYPRDYWRPETCVIGNWMGGSVGAYLRHFPKYFGATPVRDVGLIASEGRMTIPMSDGTPSGVLDITSHYFEFIPEEEADSPNPTVLAAHEVQEGKTYFILLTTSYGLYRYHIYDLVRVTGFHNKTPLVEFLSKGAHIANLTGEKLSEYHVTLAMVEVLRDLDLNLTAYSLAPVWHDEQPYYGLFVERGDLHNLNQGVLLAEHLERRLGQINIEYAAKRESLRLGPIRLQLLADGTWISWDRQRLARTGGTLEQYKHPCLIVDLKFRESMTVEEELAPS